MNPLDLLEPGRLLAGALFRDLLATVDEVPAPGTQVGLFRVVRELGRGGMGVVLLAERNDGQYQQQVALKWLPRGAGTLSEALFRRERQILAELRHPHIARLVDGGQRDDGRPWLAMELIEGDTLDRHCVRHALPLADRLVRFLDVCDALAYAHGRGVLHRDIKPSNVMVDADGRAKLLDFGIAALVGADASAPGAFTPGFASPEQQRGEAPTVAADIYQLGCLLAALLARDAAEHATVLEQTASAEPALPLSAAVPLDLQHIIRHATAAEPQARYATVAALAADLQAFLATRPISARRHTPTYLFGRLLARHRLGSAVASMLLLAMIGFVSWSIWRTRAERDRADERARVTSAVLAFVEDDLLAAADPAAMPGHEMTVRQALDRAAPQVSARFKDSPQEQIALHTTLARLYQALGVSDLAEQQARAALTLADPKAPTQTAPLQLALADILIDRDQLDAAASLLDRASAADPLQRDQLRSRLAYQRGDYAAAAAILNPYFAATDSVAARSIGPTRQLSQALLMQGDHAAALALIDALLADLPVAIGSQHPERLGLLHDRGLLLRHLGRFDEAATTLEDVLQRRRRVLGNSHPETVMTINELATVYQEQRRFALAEPLFREALALRETAYGESHHLTRNSMSNLGLLLSLSGQLQQAAQWYERTLAIEIQLTGERHPDSLALMHNIAGLYRKQGRLAEALQMHDRVCASAAEVIGADAWQLGLFEAGRAQTLQALQRPALADAAYAHAEAILAKALGNDHPRTLRVREMRASLAAQ